MDYTITWASDTPKPYTNDFGTTYYYNVKGTYNGQEKSTSIGVKDTAKAPKVGDVLFGHWEVKGDKEKFVKEQRPPAPTPVSTPGNTPTQTSFFGKDTASIERQVSLKCAVEFAGYVLANKPKGSAMSSADVVFVAEAFDAYLKGEKPRVKPKQPQDEPEEQEHPEDEPQEHPDDKPRGLDDKIANFKSRGKVEEVTQDDLNATFGMEVE